jgi:hypothetical protein
MGTQEGKCLSFVQEPAGAVCKDAGPTGARKEFMMMVMLALEVEAVDRELRGME